MTFLAEVSRHSRGPRQIQVPKDVSSGLYAARVKSTLSGASADIIVQVRPFRGGQVFDLPPGTAGLETGDQVAVRLTVVDIDEWLDRGDSVPLARFAARQGEGAGE